MGVGRGRVAFEGVSQASRGRVETRNARRQLPPLLSLTPCACLRVGPWIDRSSNGASHPSTHQASRSD